MTSVAELKKGVEEDLVKLQQLNYKTSAGSYIPCIWDVGAGTVGPGGQNGMYARQCRKFALIDNEKQLCSIHARKFYIEDARSKTASSMLQEKKVLRRTAAKQGIFRPYDGLVTAEQFKKFKAGIATNASCVNMDKKTAKDGVYTIEQAMCAIRP